MNGDQLTFALDIGIVFCLLLLTPVCLARAPTNRNARLIAAMLICNVCYVVLGRQDYSYWIPEPYRIDVGALTPLLNIGRNLTPGLFMLLCCSLFQERRKLPAWLLAAFAAQVLLEPADWVLPAAMPGFRLITETLPATLESLFACLAIYWTVAGWRSDLVEMRRRLRLLLLAVIGLMIVGSSLLLRVIIPEGSVQNYHVYVTLNALELLVVFAIALAWFSNGIDPWLNPNAVPTTTRAPEQDDGAGVDAAATARLEHLMTDDHVYRQPGLSVASLAQQMGMPEYRLRRLIHEGLGFRNFNAFLHQHRIREACERLRDPEQHRTPILTIGLSVGYQSINTFNRGFREVMGMTPSAYRAAHPPGTGADANGRGTTEPR